MLDRVPEAAWTAVITLVGAAVGAVWTGAIALFGAFHSSKRDGESHNRNLDAQYQQWSWTTAHQALVNIGQAQSDILQYLLEVRNDLHLGRRYERYISTNHHDLFSSFEAAQEPCFLVVTDPVVLDLLEKVGETTLSAYNIFLSYTDIANPDLDAVEADFVAHRDASGDALAALFTHVQGEFRALNQTVAIQGRRSHAKPVSYTHLTLPTKA